MNLKDYDDIQVPTNLNDYIDKGIQKGMDYKNERKSISFKKVASIALVSGVTLTAASNIPVFANELVKIPIIGELVKVLDFTESVQFGGVITDGKRIVVDSFKKDMEVLKLIPDNIINEASDLMDKLEDQL